MSEVAIDELSPLGRLIRSLGPFGFIGVDVARVNLDDLIGCAGIEGGIVRCEGDPRECITIFAPADAQTLGCVAGWISEGDQ